MNHKDRNAHAALVATARDAATFNAAGNAARASLNAYRARKASRSLLARLFGGAR